MGWRDVISMPFENSGKMFSFQTEQWININGLAIVLTDILRVVCPKKDKLLHSWFYRHI